MKIDGVPDLEFNDQHFLLFGHAYAYTDIASIHFALYVPTSDSSQHRWFGSRTHSTDFRLIMANDWTLVIENGDDWTTMSGEEAATALAAAADELGRRSRAHRVAPMRQSLATNGHFSYGEFQFHRDGSLATGGRIIFNLKSSDVSIAIDRVTMDITQRRSGWGRWFDWAWPDLLVLDVRRDRDCLAEMLAEIDIPGFADHRAKPDAAESRIGGAADGAWTAKAGALELAAKLAAVDGAIDPKEVAAIKDQLGITGQGHPGAGRLFNAALKSTASIGDVARRLAATIGKDADTVEVLLARLIAIASADGRLKYAERQALAEIGAAFGVAKAEIENRIGAVGD